MTDLYEADRVSRIGAIAGRFATACRVGDEIAFGLKGDPSYPDDFHTSRPTGHLGPGRPNCHISLLLRYRPYEAGQASGADRPVGIVDDPYFRANDGAPGRDDQGLTAHMTGRH